MRRDLEKYNSYNYAYTLSNGKVEHPSYRIHYGYCDKFKKPVSFIPNVCQVETQECFVHRKDLHNKK